jgi:uncharacterized protein (TIGR00369 family)
VDGSLPTSSFPASPEHDAYRGIRVGVALQEAPKDLSGLEILRRIITGALPAPGIGKSLRFWIAEADEGHVVFEGEPGAESLNPMGMVHGGWALTLIDSACGCVAMSVLPPGVGYTTLETKGNMTRGIKANSGVYRCEAKLMANGRQVITADATISGPDGKLYAHGTSTLLVLRER